MLHERKDGESHQEDGQQLVHIDSLSSNQLLHDVSDQSREPGKEYQVTHTRTLRHSCRRYTSQNLKVRGQRSRTTHRVTCSGLSSASESVSETAPPYRQLRFP